MITGKNYIGQKLSANGSATFKSMNPALNVQNEWVFSEATSEEVDEAVELAWEAFAIYKTVSPQKKAAFLNAIADEMEALGDSLLETYCQESGLPRGRAEGERGRTLFQLRSFAQLVEEGSWVDASIDTAIPDRAPLPKVDVRKMSIPIGPIVVFGSSNFPFAYSTAGGDTASALAAGCPVIVKSHSMHAGTGEMVASAIISAAQKTGMPNGVFSNLSGGGRTVGAQLVKHHLVKGVGFTGSIQGGRALYDMAAQREEPIPVFAEMGSINPVVILPNAIENNLEKWSTAYAESISGGTGQFCTKPGLILGLKSDGMQQFTQALGVKLVALAPGCMLHPSIHSNFNNGKELITNQQGVSVVAAYEDDVKPNYAQQKLTTVEGKTFLANKTLHTEVFGPFALVVQCENQAEMVEVIKSLEGQLSGSVIGEPGELNNYSDVISAIQGRVGRMVFNGVPTGVEVCPSMIHGGPYPASSDSRFTAVGIHSIKRWIRPFSYQNWPKELLPLELKDENPLKITRLVNNKLTKEAIEVPSTQLN